MADNEAAITEPPPQIVQIALPNVSLFLVINSIFQPLVPSNNLLNIRLTLQLENYRMMRRYNILSDSTQHWSDSKDM